MVVLSRSTYMCMAKKWSQPPSWEETRIADLEIENEDLRKKLGEMSILAADMALTSDRMKLDLILNGSLKGPRDA